MEEIKPLDSLDQVSNEPPSSDDKNLALLAHLGTLIGGFIVPLVIYLVKKEESEFVKDHARESLNFQISVLIYIIASVILAFVLIGFFLMFALGIFNLIVLILASVKASEGKLYRYPLCIRFVN
jgi:hypothetical protein